MKNIIIDRNMKKMFEFETIFVKKIFKIERIWTSNFCDNWMQQKQIAKFSIEFFQIIKQFCLAIEDSLNQAKSTNRNQINSVILQKMPPDQKNSFNQKSNNRSSKRFNEKFNHDDKSCVYEKIHFFKLCFYIKKSNRLINWKENKKIKNAIKNTS